MAPPMPDPDGTAATAASAASFEADSREWLRSLQGDGADCDESLHALVTGKDAEA